MPYELEDDRIRSAVGSRLSENNVDGGEGEELVDGSFQTGLLVIGQKSSLIPSVDGPRVVREEARGGAMVQGSFNVDGEVGLKESSEVGFAGIELLRTASYTLGVDVRAHGGVAAQTRGREGWETRRLVTLVDVARGRRGGDLLGDVDALTFGTRVDGAGKSIITSLGGMYASSILLGANVISTTVVVIAALVELRPNSGGLVTEGNVAKGPGEGVRSGLVFARAIGEASVHGASVSIVAFDGKLGRPGSGGGITRGGVALSESEGRNARSAGSGGWVADDALVGVVAHLGLAAPNSGGLVTDGFLASVDGEVGLGGGELAAGGLVTSIDGAGVPVVTDDRLVSTSATNGGGTRPAERNVTKLVELTVAGVLGSGEGLVKSDGGGVLVVEGISSGLDDDIGNGSSVNLERGGLLVRRDIKEDGHVGSNLDTLSVSGDDGFVLNLGVDGYGSTVRVSGEASNDTGASDGIGNTRVNGASIVIGTSSDVRVSAGASLLIASIGSTIVLVVALARRAKIDRGYEFGVASGGLPGLVIGIPASLGVQIISVVRHEDGPFERPRSRPASRSGLETDLVGTSCRNQTLALRSDANGIILGHIDAITNSVSIPKIIVRLAGNTTQDLLG